MAEYIANGESGASVRAKLNGLVPLPGRWQRKGVVIYPDPTLSNPRLAGEPTLIAPEGNPLVLTTLSTVWKMWYSQGGVLGIFYAESADGVHWTPYVGAGTQGAVISNAQRPYVIKIGGTYHAYVSPGSGGTADKQIDHYTSSNGVTWTLAKANAISYSTYQSNNSGGVVIAGTLYLFVEHTGIEIALYTSTNYSDFTRVGQVISGAICGPSVPYQHADGTWYMWVHTLADSQIQRWSAPALTGPWVNSEPGFDFIQMTDDEGKSTGVGQCADPFVIEVGGKTYLYYSSNQITGGQAYAQVKLAISDLPLELLVKTPGGVDAGSIENLGQIGLGFDYANNAITTNNRALSLGSGRIIGASSGSLIPVTGGLALTDRLTATAVQLPVNGYVGLGSAFCLQFGSTNFTFKGVSVDVAKLNATTGDLQLLIGKLQFGASGPTISFGSAAPTTGTWVAGSKVLNSAPSVGQPKGWVCTVSGTPGTWVSEGDL